MRVCIRAHDLGVKGTENILKQLKIMDLDGVQMVCYKAYDDIPYDRGGISREKAEAIGKDFADAGAMIPLVGAYFNPVHSDREKAQRCFDIFAEYLRACKAMGCSVVGSETGSFNDDKWTYHPRNRTEEALSTVVDTFGRLCDIAAEEGTVVAMEGAAGHVCYDVDTLDRAQKMMGKANTRVIFDIYNYLDGIIDILVNNAGIIKRIPMLEMSAAEFREVVDVDLTAPFIVAKACLPGMIEKGHGKIINICSLMSEFGRETVSAYAAAKGGLKMLTRNICSEFGQYNIQCNGIGPGYIATQQTAPLREKQADGSDHPFHTFLMGRTPVQRWGEPEDLAGPAVFLSSDASNFVNGQILFVDGGIQAYFGKQP